MKYSNKHKIINSKGLTLISLIIIIVLMIIIASVAVSSGMETFYNTQLQGFYTQLDIVQKRIDQIASTTKNYNNLGTALTSQQRSELSKILKDEGSELGLNVSTFRYFSIEQLKEQLNLSDIDYSVFVHFDSRTVIAEKGITINGKTYHILNTTVYYVEQNDSKNLGMLNKLEFKIDTYGKDYYYSNTVDNTLSLVGKDKYKVTVKPINKSGQTIVGGILKYKKSNNTHWETANNLEFEVSNLTKSGILYNIVYEDNNRNQVSKTIKIWLNTINKPMITVQ